MKKLKVYISKNYTKDYIRVVKNMLFYVVDDYIQLEDECESETFEIVASDNVAETILAMNDYDMWYAVEM